MGLASCNKADTHISESTSAFPCKDEITIMHIEAENDDFVDYINQVSRQLNIKINIVPCPLDANNRQAEVATILASGDSSVDLISVNDEMVSEIICNQYPCTKEIFIRFLI